MREEESRVTSIGRRRSRPGRGRRRRTRRRRGAATCPRPAVPRPLLVGVVLESVSGERLLWHDAARSPDLTRKNFAAGRHAWRGGSWEVVRICCPLLVRSGQVLYIQHMSTRP
jgi:hypothetical protein